ncbi:T9SS type A sorting domain-containing protein [Pontibacter diazotrophicus]|nr:T9SS type A sorting domain-containing protein [Pontibacter diazotrophicus]
MKKRYFLTLLLSFVCIIMQQHAWAQALGEYTWKNVQIQGGGFVTGIIYNPSERNLVYARTDVGGAYRWSETNKNWIPLTDHLGRDEENYTGILSLATDPSDPNNVYLATGLYTQSWAGAGAILASADKGNTWTKTELPIKLGGNEDGRSAGERLMVDPNLGSVLYLGSSTDGLWKSTDSGGNWSKVNSFPVESSPIASGGISFVLFDEASGTTGELTPTIYVGVLQTGTNLYKSTDGGSTWQAIADTSINYMPHQAALAADGTLYITYSNGPGPNNVTAGAVWKLDAATGQWTNINPPAGQGGYAGLSLDPKQSGTLIVSTIGRWWPRDEVFYSSNGGANWTALLNEATFDHSLAPYAAASTPHWIGDVEIDPFHSDNAWFTTGYGVYNSNNLSAAESNSPAKWMFQNQGLEETVPLQLISPPSGAPLVSALGDIDGFRHENLEASPAAGRLSPTYGTNTSIDFAENKPAFMARTHYNADGRFGAYSTDGGGTWTAFASAPAGTTGGGTIAVSADGTTLVWAPAGASGVFYSRNNGGSWTGATGISKGGLKPVADRVNAKKFYVYDVEAGRVMLSTNGGTSFSAAATGLPTVPDWQLWAANLEAVFGVEGELWLTNPNGGLYRSTNSGGTFLRQFNVQEAVKVGFGKAAPGETYPAVYIAGNVNDESGFFRSDDAGATWVRVNDEQHQFGGVNDITGDPRVFGRVYVATSGRGIVYGDIPGIVNGIEDEQKISFTYFPNPFSTTLQLEADAPFTYTIVNMLGVQVAKGQCSGKCAIGANLEAGIYILTVKQREKVQSVKILKY